ncbi:MAG: transketolase [Candidatus Yanofskybacteria bacterium]|nr:transketolase [Candidatus Yanofskybacteria bacterium]
MVNDEYLTQQARKIRRLILEMIFRAKASHIGCALSIVDILVALYFGDILKLDPAKPDWNERDRFILSKGHGCVALYATLATRGFFPLERLNEYGTDGTLIGDHNTLHALPGIETTNGSLGHGLAMGIGMALNSTKNSDFYRVFVLAGDGECQEGSIWEGLMFAGFHKINNLALIIDNNDLITVGNTSKILGLEPLDKKLEDFGWQAVRVNGHSFRQLLTAIKPGLKPIAVIADTVKGKGISFMENGWEWHGKCPTPEQYERAKEELGEQNAF